MYGRKRAHSSDWIGVDQDRTLAYYDGQWRDGEIGKPILPMVKKVKEFLERGITVKILTARANTGSPEGDRQACEAIQKWLVEEAGLPKLEVTASKDYHMIAFYDDLAIHIVPNTGMTLGDFLNEQEAERLR